MKRWTIGFAIGCLAVASPTVQRGNSYKAKPVTGVAIHFCSCEAPCGCMFAGSDLEGCNLTAVYHFTSGGYMSKKVEGLTAIVVYQPAKTKACCDADKEGEEPKPQAAERPQFVIYLPKAVSEQQRKDLRSILEERDWSFVTSKREFRTVPIDFRRTPTGYRVEVPGVLKAETHAMMGDTSRQLFVENVPFMEGSRWYLGRTSEHSYTDPKDPDWTWSYPRRNGAWCKFSWGKVER